MQKPLTTPQMTAQAFIPNAVALTHTNTVVTATSSTSKDSKKNERVIALYSILFVKAQYDRHGTVSSMLPAERSDDVMELFSSASSTSEQSRILHDSLDALSDEISTERNYLSRATRFLFLSTTVLSYMLHPNFHNGYIDSQVDQKIVLYSSALKSTARSFGRVLQIYQCEQKCRSRNTFGSTS